ncbi:hypothetical protein [Scytonema sp. NUACC26]|uniref:hypothetical protein n=1 Tax=Scytonema sp. NUACC26 TaxID=3140176 RepID=UPI0038B415D7
MITKSNHKQSLAEKEYEFISQERERIEKMINQEIEQLRADKMNLILDIASIRKNLEELDAHEEVCQRKLVEANLTIAHLKEQLGLRNQT